MMILDIHVFTHHSILTFFFQDHPNIIKMYEFFEDEKRYYLVTE